MLFTARLTRRGKVKSPKLRQAFLTRFSSSVRAQNKTESACAICSTEIVSWFLFNTTRDIVTKIPSSIAECATVITNAQQNARAQSNASDGGHMRGTDADPKVTCSAFHAAQTALQVTFGFTCGTSELCRVHFMLHSIGAQQSETSAATSN